MNWTNKGRDTAQAFREYVAEETAPSPESFARDRRPWRRVEFL